MPGRLTVTQTTDSLAIDLDVGDNGHFRPVGLVLHALEANRRAFQLTKIGGEIGERVVVQLLTAKPQHLVVDPGLVNGINVFRRRHRQVYARDIRAKAVAGRCDCDSHLLPPNDLSAVIAGRRLEPSNLLLHQFGEFNSRIV